MPGINYKKTIELGLKAATSRMCEADKVWSRYSRDKVDIGEALARVIRTLSKTLPLERTMRALSIGSSSEPQFRLLETNFRGGLYLFDLEDAALDIVKERIERQCTDHVTTISGNYNDIFPDKRKTGYFLSKWLRGKKVELVTLHHSLYYSKESDWYEIFNNVYTGILAATGAMHAVLMASKSEDPSTTTWLYNTFAGKFCGCYNDQDLIKFRNNLKKDRRFNGAQLLTRTNRVQFFTDDFEKFMAVVWMILLYPDVHQYSLRQREEITEFVHNRFWAKQRPIIQEQDHLVVYKGLDTKGLI